MHRTVNWLSAVAAACMLLILAPDVAFTREKTIMMPAITYWSNVSSETMPLEMTVSEEGVGALQIRSNRGQQDETVVGRFSIPLGMEQLSVLLSALRSDAFRDLQPPSGIKPGQSVRSLTIVEPNQKKVQKFAAAGLPAPLPFRAAEDAALKLVATLRMKPVQALSVQKVAITPQVERGNAAQLDLTLGNPGSGSIALAAPAEWSAAGMTLMIVAVRSDIPPTKIMSQHQKFVPLSDADLIQSSIDPEEGRILIQPGRQLTWTLKKGIDWPPGSYDVHLAMMFNLLDQEGKKVGRYELFSLKYPVKCEGDADADENGSQPPPEDSSVKPPPFP